MERSRTAESDKLLGEVEGTKVYIQVDSETAERLAKLAARLGRTEDSLIREAIRAWDIEEKPRTWPEIVMRFEGDPTIPPFESYRE